MKTRSHENNQTEVSSGISVKEAGRRGGCSTLDRRGIAFFREIRAKGGRKTAELYHDLLAEFGKRGGRPRRPSFGESFGNEHPETKGG